MLTGGIRSKIDALGNAFWTGGSSIFLQVKEQINNAPRKVLAIEFLATQLQCEFARRVTAVEKLKAA